LKLYEPLIERDLAAIPAAVRTFRAEHSPEELFVAIARFAVLAYAPSQHGKHALLACLSTWELRDELGPRFDDMVIACATYVADARQPWSEPPILEPPEPGTGTLDELRAAVRDGDRLLAERWLAARLDDGRDDLLTVATDDFEDMGHKLIIANACLKLADVLGEKGRYALLRVAVWELTAYRGEPPVERCAPELDLDCDGSLESAHEVFLYDAAQQAGVLDRLPRRGSRREERPGGGRGRPPLHPYNLARDYGATLKAHAVAKRFGPKADAFVRAVHDNLERSEGFEGWQ
jgi:hypothetical protein